MNRQVKDRGTGMRLMERTIHVACYKTATVHIAFYRQADRHALFNSLFSRTTWVIRHQKGQTNLNFNEARNGGEAMASAGPYAHHLRLTPGRQPCQQPSTSSLNFFLTDGCSS